jgi:hypothetical protein
MSMVQHAGVEQRTIGQEVMWSAGMPEAAPTCCCCCSQSCELHSVFVTCCLQSSKQSTLPDCLHPDIPCALNKRPIHSYFLHFTSSTGQHSQEMPHISTFLLSSCTACVSCKPIRLVMVDHTCRSTVSQQPSSPRSSNPCHASSQPSIRGRRGPQDWRRCLPRTDPQRPGPC